MPCPLAHAFERLLLRKRQIDEMEWPHCRNAKLLAISSLQRGTAEHHASGMTSQFQPDPLQPSSPVLIRQPYTLTHLADA
eukprot:gene7199-8924_t